MNYKDKLKTQLRIKQTILFFCGAGIIGSVILLLVFLNQQKMEYVKYLIIVSVVCLIIIRPVSKVVKKDKEQLKIYEDKEKAEKKARYSGKNPTNKFNLGLNRTNALLGGSTTNEQEEKKEKDPIGRFKYKK
ncbi:MAG: hypothetical protein J6J23_03460 [Clostridia bacterium]|nr:hypothetical protein [Clostridia bacterium]